MAYIRTTVGDVDIIIEDATVAGESNGRRDTSGGGRPTERVINDLLLRTQPVITSLAAMGREAFSKIDSNSRPDEISLETNMGYSSALNAWVFKGDASLTFKVAVKWKKDDSKG